MAVKINPELLTAAELVEYRQRSVLGGGSDIAKRVFWFAIALAAGIAVLVAVTNYFTRTGYPEFANVLVLPAGIIGLIWLALNAFGSVNGYVSELEKSRDTRLKIYLSKIGYQRRVDNRNHARTESGGSEGANSNYKYTWMTGNYDPARYYSYSKSERDYMKMTGMDADTYDSNMPD